MLDFRRACMKSLPPLILLAASAFGGQSTNPATVFFGAGLSLPGVEPLIPMALTPMWTAGGISETAAPEATADGGICRRFAMTGGWGADAPVFAGRADFHPASDGAVHASWTLLAERGGPLAEAFVGFRLPLSRFAGGTALFDSRPIAIPAERGDNACLFRGVVSSLSLRDRDNAECLSVVFDEPVRLLLQDDRFWNGDNLAVRVFFVEGPPEVGVECAVAGLFSTPAAGPLVLSDSAMHTEADPGWIPLPPSEWIAPGSALDFSAVVPHHTPAGKFGRVVVRDGHFEFEKLPGVPQRFYGANLVASANLPETREEADRFAAQLARVGYNAIRLHHHEYILISPDGTYHPGLDDTMPNPTQMAKFDLLVAACVEHGIYLTTDLYVSRAQMTPWRAIGINRDGTVPQDDYKLLVSFWEPAYSNLCAWSRNFLRHVNPYTGRCLAEEPALACLGLVNEGSLGNWGGTALRCIPGAQEAWREWLARHGEPPADIPDKLESTETALFLAERETMFYKRFSAFVRDKLRCPAPLSSLASWYEPPQYALPRRALDYVDKHFYIDHPASLGNEWQLPSRCDNENPVRGERAGVPRVTALRHLDKPFCVTEFNYAAPGRYRGAGGLIAGSLASLQDWDGLWRFAWSHGRRGIAEPEKPHHYFDVSGDPLALAAERAALCLFLRRDLEPIEAEAPTILDETALRAGTPTPAPDGAIAWTARIGRTFGGNGTQSRASGESPVSILPDGTFLVATPCTVGGMAESGVHEIGPLRFEILAARNEEGAADNVDSSIVDNGDQIGLENHSPAMPTTIWASSLDGLPLVESSRILVTHLTDVRNCGMAFADIEQSILIEWGRLPHIIRTGKAKITLAVGPGDYSVYALNTAGRRVREVVHTRTPDGRLAFIANVAADPETPAFLYEIACQ